MLLMWPSKTFRCPICDRDNPRDDRYVHYRKITDNFSTKHDADGNQPLIQSKIGVWSVVYNAENRPVRWTQGDTIITMAFDRLGRRVEMRTVKDGEEALQRFVYDNYLCIQRLRGTDNALYQSYVWNPTEPIATRFLVFQPAAGEIAYYFHDGNKNVSEVFYHALQNGIAAHYDYAPFGAVTRPTRVTTYDILSVPLRILIIS